jgi:Family of unknown function (DUF6232)
MAQHCTHCGTEVYDEGNFCHVCGKSKAGTPSDSGTALKPVVLPPDAESTFFEDGTVSVTNIHFTVPGRIFAMSDVKSARLEKTGAARSWPTACYLLGVGAFLARLYRFGLVLFIVGALLNVISRPKFTIVLDSASGEVRAFTNGDRDYISEIVDALKKAIAYRR